MGWATKSQSLDGFDVEYIVRIQHQDLFGGMLCFFCKINCLSNV